MGLESPSCPSPLRKSSPSEADLDVQMRSIFFPIYVWLIEPAACYETETQITVSDHDIKQLVTFGAC